MDMEASSVLGQLAISTFGLFVGDRHDPFSR